MLGMHAYMLDAHCARTLTLTYCTHFAAIAFQLFCEIWFVLECNDFCSEIRKNHFHIITRTLLAHSTDHDLFWFHLCSYRTFSSASKKWKSRKVMTAASTFFAVVVARTIITNRLRLITPS